MDSNLKQKAAKWSIITNSGLIILKVIAGIASNSLAVLAEAAHSGVDLIASFIAFWAVKKSSLPADEDHPYGHGKYEHLSGMLESILVIGIGVVIIYESILRIISPTPMNHYGFAVIVMMISALVNFFVSRYLYRVAKQTDSDALYADALHLSTDVYTSIGILIGLILIWFTGILQFDQISAIVVASFIIYEGWSMTKKTIRPLLDTAIDLKELELVKNTLQSFDLRYANFHKLRSRKSGDITHIDLHLMVAPETTVQSAHELCDILEKKIKEVVPKVQTVIHVEPCKRDCKNCRAFSCTLRKESK